LASNGWGGWLKVGAFPEGMCWAMAYQLGVAMSVLQSLREIWTWLLSSLISISPKTEIRWMPGLNYRYKFALLWWQSPPRPPRFPEESRIQGFRMPGHVIQNLFALRASAANLRFVQRVK